MLDEDTARGPLTWGRYRVRRELSRGAGGAVYACDDPLLGRMVAVHVLAPQDREAGHDAEPSPRADPLRGPRYLAGLRHPNVVQIYDAGVDHGRPYRVLELIDGPSLNERLQHGSGLSAPVALRIVRSMAEALQLVHERGLVHGDVKPTNIVLRSTGEPVLVDFGLARPFGPPATAGDGGGLAAARDWPPPGDHGPPLPAHPRLDVWGLAATLHCALANQRWPAGTPVEQMRESVARQLDQSPPPAPPFVTDIVRSCVSADAPSRCPSMAALQRRLDAAIDHLEQTQAPTLVVKTPAEGQTLLLHVERREAELPGSYREYAIEAHLGEGAYGTVYRATELLSKQAVALKVLKAQWLTNRAAVERFRREAMLLTRLDHPNVVRFRNFGRYGSSFFIAMELVAGPTLRSRLRETGALPVAEAARLIRQILGGLAALADAGIVHRDLKPPNVKICEDRAVLIDFGIACGEGLQELTATGAFVGTPSFAAPEQVRAATVTPATDVYAAGVMLYEMLTGRLPYDASSSPAMLLKIATGTPRPITELRPDLPPPLVSLVHRMLARTPEQRPSAQEAAQQLQGMADPLASA